MRLLLDTNIFIFMAIDKDSLSADVSALIEDYSNVLYVSAETMREIGC